MKQKPTRRQIGDAFERARFFEKMGRAGDDVDLDLTTHLRARLLVHSDDYIVFTANDEQSGRFYFRQGVAGQIGATATRHDRSDTIRKFCRSHEGSATAGAR